MDKKVGAMLVKKNADPFRKSRSQRQNPTDLWDSNPRKKHPTIDILKVSEHGNVSEHAVFPDHLVMKGRAEIQELLH